MTTCTATTATATTAGADAAADMITVTIKDAMNAVTYSMTAERAMPTAAPWKTVTATAPYATSAHSGETHAATTTAVITAKTGVLT